jgi:hypothetical protein
MTNDPDQFASDLYAELRNTARFTSIDSSELEAVYAAHDVATWGPPPPPPPPLNETSWSGTKATSTTESERERLAMTSPQTAVKTLEQQTAAPDKTRPSTGTTCHQDATAEAEVPKQRRIRVIPSSTFPCLVAYEIRSQIQVHLRASQRSAASKKAVKKSAPLPLPILAGGPSSKSTLHPHGQQRLSQLQKPPLVTVRIYLNCVCISRAPPASVAQP